MKKLLIVAALMLALVFTVVACTGEPTTDGTTVADTTVAENPTEAPTEDATTEAPTEEATTEEATTEEATTEEATTEEATTEEATTEEPTTEEVTTEEPTTDPADPLLLLEPEDLKELSGMGAPNVNQVAGCEVMTEGKKTFVRLTAAAGGDPYLAFIPLGSDYTLPNYMAISYRTNSAVEGQFFMGSGAGWTGAGDSFMVTWTEGDWSFVVVDLSQTGVTSITDGKLTYARMDFFAGNTGEGEYFDVQYIGFFNTAEYADEYDFKTNPPYIEIDNADAGKVGHSFDTFYVNGEMFFEADGGAGDKLTAIDNTISFELGEAHDSLALRGWIGFGQAIDQFGYFVDNYEFVFGEFRQDTEAGVLAAGGENASRFQIVVPLTDLGEGPHMVGFVVKLADGTIVRLRENLNVVMPTKPTHYENYNVPMESWTVSGHKAGVTPAGDATHGNMVSAGGLENGALLHQGAIGLGEIDLSKYDKVIVYCGCDASGVTQGYYDVNANNRIILTKVDTDGTMSPADEIIIASATYTLHGWAPEAVEIDLSGIDYNGPVYVTYDTLPGTFMLVGAVEFIGGKIEADEPEVPASDNLVIDIANTTGVATDAAWIPNQQLLGPHNAGDDTTGQIGAINAFNNNYLGHAGYGNIIIGGYVSVGEIDLSKYSSVTLLVAGGGAGQTNEAWMTDAEGNKLNAANASFVAGNGSTEGTQTIRTITLNFDTDYNGEVRFLFTQTQVVTVVGITFNA